jgi:hypothetical protein
MKERLDELKRDPGVVFSLDGMTASGSVASVPFQVDQMERAYKASLAGDGLQLRDGPRVWIKREKWEGLRTAFTIQTRSHRGGWIRLARWGGHTAAGDCDQHGWEHIRSGCRQFLETGKCDTGGHWRLIAGWEECIHCAAQAVGTDQLTLQLCGQAFVRRLDVLLMETFFAPLIIPESGRITALDLAVDIPRPNGDVLVGPGRRGPRSWGTSVGAAPTRYLGKARNRFAIKKYDKTQQLLDVGSMGPRHVGDGRTWTRVEWTIPVSKKEGAPSGIIGRLGRPKLASVSVCLMGPPSTRMIHYAVLDRVMGSVFQPNAHGDNLWGDIEAAILRNMTGVSRGDGPGLAEDLATVCKNLQRAGALDLCAPFNAQVPTLQARVDLMFAPSRVDAFTEAIAAPRARPRPMAIPPPPPGPQHDQRSTGAGRAATDMDLDEFRYWENHGRVDEQEAGGDGWDAPDREPVITTPEDEEEEAAFRRWRASAHVAWESRCA